MLKDMHREQWVRISSVIYWINAVDTIPGLISCVDAGDTPVFLKPETEVDKKS